MKRFACNVSGLLDHGSAIPLRHRHHFAASNTSTVLASGVCYLNCQPVHRVMMS